MKGQNPKLATSFIGKWHLGHNEGCLPPERGFDFFYGLPYSHEEGYPGPTPEDLIWPPVPLMKGMDIVQQPVNLSDITQRYTSQALNLLDQYAKSNQSFLMHVAYEEPHVPLFANPAFLNTSRRGLYGDAVEQMDDSVGQILQKLRDTGLSKNTLVYFTSDNGAWINPSSGIPGAPPAPLTGGCNGPLQDGKGSTWEGGMREPAIFWWPNVIKPGLSMELITMMDVFPTFLSLSNMTSPNNATYPIDGLNIAPLLLGTNKTSPHDYIYYWREHTVYAVRYGPWKAHYYTRTGFDTDPPVEHNPPLLFNVDWDPAERVPLNVSDYADIVANIDNALQQHLEEVVPGVSQYEKQRWTLVPCCHGSFNSSDFLDYIREHEWSLALWEELGCVCMEEKTDTSM
jgi:arylsulfatase A-like enzyme